ncbi:uncharacterized protein LOC134275554 [Saccostrea cucullata]|uniref:uncharacterized protein LOC134275554 n=1 Tax=Saccostrea cuccullata TaxID=36930 RepID=UPI002ED04AC9
MITREDSSILLSDPTISDPILCDNRGNPAGDHYAVHALIQISKPKPERKTVSFRKLSEINIDEFKKDISSSVSQQNMDMQIDELVTTYNTSLKCILDSHAPVQTKEIIIRPKTPWYHANLKAAKQARRKAERKMRDTDLTIHKQIYRKLCTDYSKLLLQSQQDYYSTKILEIGHDQKQLYNLTNKLMGKVKETIFPAHDSKEMLANRFCEFFTGKIETIRSELSKSKQVNVSEALKSDIQYVGQKLIVFTEATNKEIYDIIMGAPTKSCESDPIPTSLLKPCIEELLPLITVIINKSLSGSSVPTTFKEAIIRPILKKPEFDCNELKNYRPVSNLPFISKILEKVVSKRLKHHLEVNNLQEPLQSAYRACHSTETALLRVHHDIVSALDKNSCMALVMLDLSAAFDVIDHTILLRRLRFSFGISGAALEWIESYLTQRTQ